MQDIGIFPVTSDDPIIIREIAILEIISWKREPNEYESGSEEYKKVHLSSDK